MLIKNLIEPTRIKREGLHNPAKVVSIRKESRL